MWPRSMGTLLEYGCLAFVFLSVSLVCVLFLEAGGKHSVAT